MKKSKIKRNEIKSLFNSTLYKRKIKYHLMRYLKDTTEWVHVKNDDIYTSETNKNLLTIDHSRYLVFAPLGDNKFQRVRRSRYLVFTLLDAAEILFQRSNNLLSHTPSRSITKYYPIDRETRRKGSLFTAIQELYKEDDSLKGLVEESEKFVLQEVLRDEGDSFLEKYKNEKIYPLLQEVKNGEEINLFEYVTKHMSKNKFYICEI